MPAAEPGRRGHGQGSREASQTAAGRDGGQTGPPRRESVRDGVKRCCSHRQQTGGKAPLTRQQGRLSDAAESARQGAESAARTAADCGSAESSKKVSDLEQQHAGTAG